MILFDQDRLTGSKQFYSYNPATDEHHLTTVEDVSGLLDHLKAKRNATPEFGKVEEFAHYATLPNTVIIELMNKGIDINDKNCTKRLISEINTNYPWLKATTKHHA